MLENKKVELFLAAINPFTQTNIVENVEKKISGKDFISWGDNNRYPDFLLECYNNCSTLQSIINGTGDFVVGDAVACIVPNFEKSVNKNGDTIIDIVGKIANDYLIFGSFALQVIRNFAGGISEIYWMDVNKLRSDEKNEVFFYSEDWNKSLGRVKTLKYPKFNPDDNNPTSIFYYKNPKSRTVYGLPLWCASAQNAQIDIDITKFHKNELGNNFLGSKMISFNNGTPSDELKEEIERNLNEKFSGTDNAGRIMISFSESRDNAPEVLNLGTDDFDTRYSELEKRNTQQLFVAFRAQPILFGMEKENNGFSQDEFLQAFALYNRTVVKPIQNAIIDVFDKIFGVEGSVTITPFSIEVADNNLTDKEIIS